MDIKRKLVTVRKIDRVDPIEGADAIEVATIEGWQVVTKKGEFLPGSYCVYFEIDSFLPTGHPAWQFLVDKQGRTFEGVLGHRLRTVKLRGQVSQGFIAKIDMFPEIVNFALSRACDGYFCENDYAELRNEDFAPLLGIKKWEQPLPAELAGQAEGLFPSFIRKTDQERCQNLVPEIFGYEDTMEPFDVAPLLPEALTSLSEKGILKQVDGVWMKVKSAKADRNARYEVTLKMDGSSMTVFARAGINEIEAGVCSRNLQLKVNEANADNTFISVALKSGLLGVLEDLARDGEGSFAVQGELMGPGIQGNRENLKVHQLFIFDVQNLDKGTYLTPEERKEFVLKLYREGANPNLVQHVPKLHNNVTLDELGITNVKELLAFAEGPSLTHSVREGLVFKRIDGQFSFKAISNQFLSKEKD
jgi:hypothetical protein